MDMQLHSSPLERSVAAIAGLDLDPVKQRLVHALGEHRWSQARAEQAALGYRRYLMLRAKYPGASLSPPGDVDAFWHAHILDTRRYAEDCEAIFGAFLHHHPSLGEPGFDEAAHEAAAWVMAELYQREFGEPLSALSAASIERAAPGRVSGPGERVVIAYCA